ncbi:phage tail tape measure protein [Enterobacter sp. CGMCC 5087]|uniref:phage tail tape measure protein n=1 Tax=Enterobacter sp. CGMCC 5087 TaxID=2183878 RepID=UPI000D679345|nr:phage tail tape measure protein [Enterobacter sp. CGMCC 5087]PWI80485.1 phage tail tape measure protein [Enterobacter sp. CGMCC 5087]
MQQTLSINVAFGAIDKLTRPLNAAKAASKGLGASVNSTRQQIQSLDKQTRQFEKSSQIIAKKTAEMNKLIAKRDELRKQEFVSEEQKAQIEEFGKQIGKLNRQIKAEETGLQKAKDGFKRFGLAMEAGGSVTGRIIQKTREYTVQLRQQEAQLLRVTKAQESYDKAKKLSQRIRNGGAKAAALGGVALWGGMRLMQPGIEFDQAFSQTLANAQLQRNSIEAKALREQAMQLARTTHYNAVQATQGQYALISGGMSSQNARTALPSILNMALAAHADLGEAANVGSNILDHFQLQADQATRVADVMVGTFTRSKTSLSSLNETMEYVGTVASNAGMSLEQTAAAAATLAKNGLTGSIAGTGLKDTIKGLYAPAAAGTRVLDELKIKTITATGAVRPLADVMSELWEKTRKFDQGSQFAIFKQLFGTEGLTAAQVLARASAEGNLQAFEKYLGTVKGLAAKTSKEMTDNYAGDMQMLHSAWDGLWTNLEDGSDSPMRAIVQKITKIIQALADWTKKHPALTAAIMDTVLAVGALSAVLGTLFTLVGTALGVRATLKFAMSLFRVGAAADTAAVSLTAAGDAAVVAGTEVATAGEAIATAGAASAVAAGRVSLFSGAITLLGGSLKWLARLLLVFEGIPALIFAIGAAADYMWSHLNLTDRLTELEKHGKGVASSMARVWLASTADARVAISLFDLAIKKGRQLLGLEDSDQQALLKSKILALQGDVAGAQLPGKLQGMVNTLKSDIKGALKKPPPPGDKFGTVHWDGGKKKKKKRGDGGYLPEDDGRPGAIVFKTLPPWLALKNGFNQPTLSPGHGGILAATQSPAMQEKKKPDIGTNVAGDINLHIHIDGTHMDRRELVNDIERQVMAALNKLKRQNLASLKDRE